MKRIPEVFAPVDGDPDTSWVLKGEFSAVRMRDGVGILVADGMVYMRHTAPADETLQIPAGAIRCSVDGDPKQRWWIPMGEHVTLYTSGWSPTLDAAVGNLPNARMLLEDSQFSEIITALRMAGPQLPEGTYEITGPRCGLAHEHEDVTIRAHGSEPLVDLVGPQTRVSIRAYLVRNPMRGIMFHRLPPSDGSAVDGEYLEAKVTSRSLGLPWPPRTADDYTGAARMVKKSEARDG